MYIAVTLLAILILSSLTWFGRRSLENRRRKRMSDNTYNTALTLWNFARIIKDHIDDVSRGRAEVIDFRKISVPAGTGYNVCLELAGYGFRLHAVPERYDRTGRVSLYVDNAMTVRALDRGGENATAEDPEYTGEEMPLSEVATPAKLDSRNPEELIHRGKELIRGSKSGTERIIIKNQGSDRKS